MAKKDLSPKQYKCLALLAAGETKQKEIAAKINVSEKTICAWKKDAVFLKELERMTRSNICFLAGKAFRTEMKLLDSKNQFVRLQAAQDILNRAGLKPTDKLEFGGELELGQKTREMAVIGEMSLTERMAAVKELARSVQLPQEKPPEDGADPLE